VLLMVRGLDGETSVLLNCDRRDCISPAGGVEVGDGDTTDLRVSELDLLKTDWAKRAWGGICKPWGSRCKSVVFENGWGSGDEQTMSADGREAF